MRGGKGWVKTTVTTEGLQKLPHNQQTAHRRKNLTRLGYAPMRYNPATPSLQGIGQSVQKASTMQPIPKQSVIQSMQKQSTMQSTEQPMKQQLAAQGQPQPDAQATQRHRQTCQKKRVVQSAEQPTKKGRTGQSMPLQSDVKAMQMYL